MYAVQPPLLGIEQTRTRPISREIVAIFAGFFLLALFCTIGYRGGSGPNTRPVSVDFVVGAPFVVMSLLERYWEMSGRSTHPLGKYKQ